jgi:hypothetical protein
MSSGKSTFQVVAGNLVGRAREAGFKGSKARDLSARVDGTRVYLSLVSFRSDGLGGPALQLTVTAIPAFPPLDEAAALGLCTAPVPVPDRDITRANLANRTPFGLFSIVYPEAGDQQNDNQQPPLSLPAGYMLYGERTEDETWAAVERWFDHATSWAAGFGPAQLISRIGLFEQDDPLGTSSIARMITGGIRLAALISLGRIDPARHALDALEPTLSAESPYGSHILSLLPGIREHIG